ncbi:hypothetical protein QMY54_00211 (plasmid) [Pseudomonas rhodesiae]|nr:hypothetical protein QMY54_00211 [Pseudomonas rhodesiae]
MRLSRDQGPASCTSKVSKIGMLNPLLNHQCSVGSRSLSHQQASFSCVNTLKRIKLIASSGLDQAEQLVWLLGETGKRIDHSTWLVTAELQESAHHKGLRL